MTKFLDSLIKKNVRLYSIIAYGLILLLGIAIAYYFLPILLNYGPNTINTDFDKAFSGGFTYFTEFALIYFVLFILESLWLLWQLRDFEKFDTLRESRRVSKEKYEQFLRVVQKCYTIPKMSFVFIAIMPTAMLSLLFIFLRFTSFADFKVLLLILTVSLIDGTLTFIASKRIFKVVLRSLMNTSLLQKGKLKITPSILFQVMPIAIICIMYTFFLSYSNNLETKSSMAEKHYIGVIKGNVADSDCHSIKDLEEVLANTDLLSANDVISLVDTDGTAYIMANEFTEVYANLLGNFAPVDTQNVYFKDHQTGSVYLYKYNRLTPVESGSSIPSSALIVNFDTRFVERNLLEDNSYTNIRFKVMDQSQTFFYTYAIELASKSNNRIYGYYGSETQGTLIPFRIGNDIINVAIMYDLSADDMRAMFINALILLILCAVVTYNLARSISRDVTLIVDGINNLLTGNVDTLNRTLPVTSNDEVGQLVIAFNKIQELTKENIVEIRKNEQTLMEKERLASLGELIGGIAHNMKTPIMSTSGAAEGLTELITEYRASIDNPQVTKEDHKEIANDMMQWVTKIKSYNSYMSDIISAVKGQASQLASQENDTFNVYELSKRVEILIKHEIKSANLILTTEINCDPSITINGDINSLIQVVNNLISNSIYSYGGMPDKEIKYIIDADDSNIIMKVADQGCGMNEETKAKLFKQMYTTKGKNGTGLGLYMSYSTIRGKFNGEMSFESEENKGTTFTITIPRRS